MEVAQPKPLLVACGITKSFGPVTVLQDVDFDLRPGEVHTIMGENGAEKSTLLKILGGIHQANTGEISLDEETIAIPDPRAAQRHGIALIHQEPLTFPDLDVAENIFLGHRLEEVFEISDRITVLRDGHYVATRNRVETSVEEIIRMMVGRPLSALYEKTPVQVGEPLLETIKLSKRGRFHNISLEVRAGEIVGWRDWSAPAAPTWHTLFSESHRQMRARSFSMAKLFKLSPRPTPFTWDSLSSRKTARSMAFSPPFPLPKIQALLH